MSSVVIFFTEDEKNSSKKLVNVSELQNLNCSSIIQKMRNGDERFEVLAFSDRTFAFPIPYNLQPLAFIPQVVVRMDQVDQSSLERHPRLILTTKMSWRAQNIQFMIQHIDGIIPERNFRFPISLSLCTNMQQVIAQFVARSQTWKPYIDYISKMFKTPANRIVLHYTNSEQDTILFSFQSVVNILNFFINQNGQYILRGKFAFEILPVIFDNIESHGQMLSDRFDDTENDRINFFQSLQPTLMNLISRFQKNMLASIKSRNFFDILPILVNLVSKEFRFDANDKLIKIGLMHILSSTLVDIFLPFINSYFGNSQAYSFRCWKDLYDTIGSQSTFLTFFNRVKPKDDNIPAWCMNYFLVSSPNLPSMFIEISHKFLKYFMLPVEDFKRPPVQINNFLGTVIYSVPIMVRDSSSDTTSYFETPYTLLLTRGFVYILTPTSAANQDEVILQENLKLDVKSNEVYSMPVNTCIFIPIPDETKDSCILANNNNKIQIKFKSSAQMLSFAIFLMLTKSEIEKPVLYPPQVPQSNAQINFLNGQIHAQVSCIGLLWETFLTHEKIKKAFSKINSDNIITIIPHSKPMPFKMMNHDFSIDLFNTPTKVSKILELASSASNKSRISDYTNSWNYCLLNDMIFNFSSKASFEGLMLLRLSDFSMSITMNSKDLLKIQVKSFSVFVSNFTINDTPLLHYACLVCSNSGVVRYLIQHCKRSNLDNSKYFRTPLFYALRNPNISILQALIDAGFDIDQADSEGVSPLIYCFKMNSPERAILLLRNGASVHKTLDSKYSSALEFAIQRSDSHILTFIMPFCGEQVNAPNKSGEYPTHLCLKANFLDGIRIIETYDELYNPNMYSEDVSHPLHYIFENNSARPRTQTQYQLPQQLQSYGSVNNTTINQIQNMNPPVQQAQGPPAVNIEHVKALLRLKKINLNIKNESGDTPLLHAIRINAQKTIIEAIARDPRCDKDEYDKDGFSALYLAVQKNNTELVEILLRCGALANQPVANGDTPLFLATRNNYTRIVQILKDYKAQGILWYFQGALPCQTSPTLFPEFQRQQFPKFDNKEPQK